MPLVLAVLLAPPAGTSPPAGLTWLLFVGSSVHVGLDRVVLLGRRGTRAHALAPAALLRSRRPCSCVGCALVATALSTRELTWRLLGFFGWQFFHFQKQNLGVAALAARAQRTAAPALLERRALVAAGVGGIAGLLGHPQLLQVVGAHRSTLAVLRRAAVFVDRRRGRPGRRAAAPEPRPGVRRGLSVSLLFFAPVWLFTSPYAAVAGLTIAHGLQYLS